jgi:hypothetical protein
MPDADARAGGDLEWRLQLKQRVEAKARQFSIRLDEALTGSQPEP